MNQSYFKPTFLRVKVAVCQHYTSDHKLESQWKEVSLASFGNIVPINFYYNIIRSFSYLLLWSVSGSSSWRPKLLEVGAPRHRPCVAGRMPGPVQIAISTMHYLRKSQNDGKTILDFRLITQHIMLTFMTYLNIPTRFSTELPDMDFSFSTQY